MKHPLMNRLLAAKDYRSFLRQVADQEGRERGYRKRLAQHAGCQQAYLSQVLKGAVELTPEQADGLCAFWELGEPESDIFLTLVQLGRAGSPSLRERLRLRLEKLKESWRREDASFSQPELSAGDRALAYYSHWLHSAVHVLLTVPGLRSPEALARHLGLGRAEIAATLARLEEIGLAEQEGGKWRPRQAQLHAPRGADTAAIHHRNWRIRALELPESRSRTAVRYTSVHTLSAADMKKVREILDRAIREARALIEPSPEEKGACLLVDYFELGSNSSKE